MQNNYYVYTAKVDGVLRYIGIGKGSRDNHCVSGKSSCVELNRSLFNGADIVVERVLENVTHKEASITEKYLIEANRITLYNISSQNIKRDIELVEYISPDEIRVDKLILRTVGLTNNQTDISANLSSNEKLVYVFMKSEYDACGEDFIVLQQPIIADALALSKRTVVTCIKTLTRIGLISVKSIKQQSSMHHNAYKIYDILDSEKFALHVLR